MEWIQRGVHLLKYRDELARAEMFGPMLATAIADTQQPDLIVPVPLHRKRQLERGYNQARLIAESLSDSIGVPVAGADLVVRSIDTPHQTGLAAVQRRRNLAGAFTVRLPLDIVGRRLLLIDDVMTSGATLAECARTLHESGSSDIAVATISRAINTHR